MARVTRKRKQKARRLYGLVFSIFLSAAAGVGLYQLSPSLLDIGRIFRHAADKILEQSADTASAEPVLRGTVFDRNLQELAVSYQLYSLYARPSEVTDYQEVARIIADVTGHEQKGIFAQLNQTKSIVNLAEHLEQSQVDLIKNARLNGIYVKPVEERFYPEHEIAANLVGFTGKGIGLAGIEGEYDSLLQEGEFLTGTLTEIDFGKNKVLGRAKVDVILSIDLQLQKQLEKQLKNFIEERHASKGIALIMDPKSGAILSLAKQPTFNPNYYWQTDDIGSDDVLSGTIDHELLEQLKAQVVLRLKSGETSELFLPQTVAASDYGVGQDATHIFNTMLNITETVKSAYPKHTIVTQDNDNISIFDFSAKLASLMNGGWEVKPYLLNAVYDHERKQVFERYSSESGRERIFSPTMGIRIRHDIFSSSVGKEKNMIVHTDQVRKIRVKGEQSNYVIQEGFVGAMPAKSPELLLFMVTQQDELGPFPDTHKRVSLTGFGKDLLGEMYASVEKSSDPGHYVASAIPNKANQSNYTQFLISNRINYQEKGICGADRVKVMPQLVGLSLRKGLQRLNEYDLQVKIQGSGQIVSQLPAPGEPLQGIGECVLTLDPEI